LKISISEITTLPADLETDVQAFAAAGWPAIELSLEKAGAYLVRHSLAALKALLADAALKPVAAIGLAPTGPGLLLARGHDFGAYMASLERQILMCEALAIPCLGIGADPTRNAGTADWRTGAIENTRRAGDLARAHGVTIGIEALSLDPPVGPFLLESLPETRAFVELVDHPAIRLNFDTFHFLRSGGTLGDIATLKPGQVVHVHVSDLPDMPREQWEDSHRLMPGDGVTPLRAIRDALIGLGYDGFWALELLNEDYWKGEPAAVARIGKAAMERFAAAAPKASPGRP